MASPATFVKQALTLVPLLHVKMALSHSSPLFIFFLIPEKLANFSFTALLLVSPTTISSVNAFQDLLALFARQTKTTAELICVKMAASVLTGSFLINNYKYRNLEAEQFRLRVSSWL